MWFSLLFLALVLAVAVRQGSQGLFSAFIMLVLTVCCAAAAFGTYEWVAVNALVPYWRPDYALPVALGVIFGVPLLLLRLLFDRLIRRACLLPAWVDRVGGGVCGFITGLIASGVAATCIEMIPFNNGAILGYSRVRVVDRAERGRPGVQPPEPDAGGRELYLRPDRFAAGLASVLSSGVFSGKASFGRVNPDLLQTIGWVGAAPAEVSRFAPPRSISIVRTEPVDFVYRMTPGDARNDEPPTYDAEPAKAGHEFRMLRVRLRSEARDARKSHVFTIRQFRLVGRSADDVYAQYHPIALQQADADDLTNRHIRSKKVGRRFWPVLDDVYSPRDGNNNEVEIVFELPTDFRPSFLEYKRLARATVSFEKTARTADAGHGERRRAKTRPAATPETAGEPKGATSRPRKPGAPSDRRRGGRVRTVGAGRSGSHFGDELPLTMRSYRRLKNARISRGALVGGHLVGAVDDQASGTNPVVGRFHVPSDKRLLQLKVSRLQSRSAYGRALSSAVGTVQNYFVTDDRGRRYKVVGKYAIAAVRGRKVIEIQYFSEPAGTIGGLGKFDRIDERTLQAGDELALLFLVDPGARIVSFSTGGAASRRDDLSADNLLAPP